MCSCLSTLGDLREIHSIIPYTHIAIATQRISSPLCFDSANNAMLSCLVQKYI